MQDPVELSVALGCRYLLVAEDCKQVTLAYSSRLQRTAGNSARLLMHYCGRERRSHKQQRMVEPLHLQATMRIICLMTRTCSSWRR